MTPIINSFNPTQDVVARVLGDHQQIRRLLDRLPHVPEAEFGAVLAHFSSAVLAHEVAEEQVLYPFLRAHFAGGEAIARDRIAERKEAENMLRQAEKLLIEKPMARAMIPPLVQSFTEHLEAEERDLWMLRTVDPEELADLESRYSIAKRGAPTRTHPALPANAPGGTVLKRSAAVTDRLRDTARGRAHSADPSHAVKSVGIDEEDIVYLVDDAHRAIEQLLRQLEHQQTSAPKWVLDESVAALSAHTSTELEVLYPALQKAVPASSDLVRQARLDHEEMAMSLERLRKVPMGSEEFCTELAHIGGVFRSHTKMENTEVLPDLRDALPAQERHELGRRLHRARRHAWRHPHPRAPKSRAGIRFANRAIAVIESTFSRRPAARRAQGGGG